MINRNKDVNISLVYYHVTQRCNLNCTYCYNKKNLNKKAELSTKDALNVIKILYKEGIKEVIFTGGEPLIRGDIVKIISYTKTIGLKTELLSNGTRLYEKKEILDYLDKVIISLDTIDEKCNKRNGLKIPKLMDDLVNVCKNDKWRKKISIRSVISKYNESNWDKVEEFAKKTLECKYIKSLYIPDELSDVKNMVSSTKNIENCIEQNYSGNLCGAAYRVIAIDSNGDIYPCQCLISKEFLISNILKDDWLDEIKNSFITKKFIDTTVLNIKVCKDCHYRFLCGGGCRAISYNLYGNIDSYLECLCKFQKEEAINKLKSLIVNYG